MAPFAAGPHAPGPDTESRVPGVLRAVISPRTWLALVYLLTGLPLTATAGIILVVGLLVSLAVLPLAFLGVPVAILTLAVIDLVCRAERARTAILLGVTIPPPASEPVTDGRWWRPRWRGLLGPQLWRQAGAVVLLVPGHLAGFAVAAVIWPAALTLVAIPGYIAAGGTVSLGSEELTGIPAQTGCFVAGVAVLLLAPPTTRVAALALATVSRVLLGPNRRRALAARVGELEHSRAVVTDAAAAERRRIERDLHDGAQQRLVAMIMELARAKARLSADDADAARALIDRAHHQAQTALAELRNLVRGVHPPVLSDRGLDAALSGLAALCPVPVALDVELTTRPPATVESIAYFVVAEALTNVAKHARATYVRVTIAQIADHTVIVVHDNGVGGAEPTGVGLAGLAGRVAAIDGRLSIESPASGPTTITARLPCGS
jgi:signal transduction histidine kinase